MEVRMVDVKLYSIIRLNVVVQNIHRSLNRDALDSCDFYQLSPTISVSRVSIFVAVVVIGHSERARRGSGGVPSGRFTVDVDVQVAEPEFAGQGS